MEQIEQYIATHQDANGNLSDADTMRLLTGAHEQGDTTKAGQPVDTGAPDAGSDAKTEGAKVEGDPASQPDPKQQPDQGDEKKEGDKPAGDPVILARDGKHTIGYEKLVEAREAEKAARAEAERLRAELAAAKATPAPAAAPAEAPPADEKLRSDVEALKEVEAARAEAAYWATVAEKHPDYLAIAESSEFKGWLQSHPPIVRDAYSAVFNKGGTTAQVIEMLDAYRAARPATPAPAAAPAAPAKDVEKQVDEAVAKAKGGTPASLSEIPAGTAAHHDEAAAMAEMSPVALMNRFAGKSPAEIEAIVRRIV